MPPAPLDAVWVSEECEEDVGDVCDANGAAADDDAVEDEEEEGFEAGDAGEDDEWSGGRRKVWTVANFPEGSTSTYGPG